LLHHRGQTKSFQLSHLGNSIIVVLHHSIDRNEVQVSGIDYGNGVDLMWGEKGRFKSQMESLLNFKLPSTRKAFIDEIYHKEFFSENKLKTKTSA
jgi:hypothetical protein